MRKYTSRIFYFAACLILILAVSSCTQPSQADIEKAILQTQNAQATLSANPTIVFSPTQPPCNVENSQKEEWTTIICDTFDNNLNNWWTGTDPDYNNVSIKIANGKYIIDYRSENVSGYKGGFYYALNFINAKDYVVSLTGEIISNYKNCHWGIVVRGDYQSGYGFSIDNQGNYYLTYLAETSNNYMGNIKAGSHSAIRWEEPNTITALVEGDNLTFFVNEVPIITYQADNSTRPEISWLIWAAEGVSAVYELDDLIVKEK